MSQTLDISQSQRPYTIRFLAKTFNNSDLGPEDLVINAWMFRQSVLLARQILWNCAEKFRIWIWGLGLEAVLLQLCPGNLTQKGDLILSHTPENGKRLTISRRSVEPTGNHNHTDAARCARTRPTSIRAALGRDTLG